VRPGVSTFLIPGYNPYKDLEGYHEVISLVRDGVTQRLAATDSKHEVSREPASDNLESDPARLGPRRVRGPGQGTARDDR
jgi:hypothetical protein